MDINTWLTETKHAVGSVIPLVWAEQDLVEQAAGKLADLEAATERGYRQAEAHRQSPLTRSSLPAHFPPFGPQFSVCSPLLAAAGTLAAAKPRFTRCEDNFNVYHFD